MGNEFLVELVQSWAQALESSLAVSNWCQENAGAAPGVWEGLDVHNAPGRSDCPFIALDPVGGTEGAESEAESYTVMVCLGLSDRTVSETGRRVAHQGQKLLLGGFKPVVMGVLETLAQEYSIGRNTFRCVNPEAGFWELDMEITVTTDNPI